MLSELTKTEEINPPTGLPWYPEDCIAISISRVFLLSGGLALVGSDSLAGCDLATQSVKAAQGLTSTFSKGTPNAADANAAISGLLGPLSALAGK